MLLYSTRNHNHIVSLKEAVLNGLAPDKGLYLPLTIPRLRSQFIESLKKMSFHEIAYEICHAFFGDTFQDEQLQSIVEKTISFPAPLVELDEKRYILELFHGPSYAFKDFGARFMAQLMSYFIKDEKKELIILVATSGDTGGAVAAGFYNCPGIKVVILFPSGKVSKVQQQQLTSYGDNISALEVDGTFDDCQALVKTAFLDEELKSRLNLSSANSINIARLIPQCFYYFEGYKQLREQQNKVNFCVPSGNFGNLTAGVISKQMGLPVGHFIAATNQNDVVPVFLKTGKFNPKASIQTISNAMDVGSPSNFERIQALYGSTWNNIKNDISGYSFSDEETALAIREVYHTYQYITEPHTSIGLLAAKKFIGDNPGTSPVIILGTAHPIKFEEKIIEITGIKPDTPSGYESLTQKQSSSIQISTNFPSFKSLLFDKFAHR